MMDFLIVLKANTTHDSPVKFHGLFSVHRFCVPFARGRATSIQYNTIQYSASPTGGTTVSRYVTPNL